MATLAVFLYPEKVGIARVKAPGAKPSFSSVQWRNVKEAGKLIDEPLMLATLIREMVGDDNKYDVYLNVWPGAYNAVMFSYTKKGKRDINRLRQSELETVFHGDLNTMYSTDLLMNKDKPAADGKCHRIILNVKKDRVRLLMETFRSQKMTVQRIAPMDVTAAESALRFWVPRDKGIHVCMVLDEGCTSVIFFQDGNLQALRTIPNGFGSVLAAYEDIMGMEHDPCLDMIRRNGVNVSSDEFDMPAIQDDVLRMLNRITVDTVKTLHNTFGDEAVIDQVLLCGNFVSTTGLVEYLNTMLDTQCLVANAQTLKPGASGAIVLDEKDLEDMFSLASSTEKGCDLLFEMKKSKSDKIQTAVVCTFMTLVVGGIMAVTPLQMHQIRQERDAASNLMSQPEYQAIQALFDQRDQLTRYKNNLSAAIDALPHGSSQTADIISSLNEITTDYGTVLKITTDYGSKTISVSFTTLNYDSFVYWQQEITEGGRFSFLTPPTFSGNGLIYTVEANLTATDFDAPIIADDAAQEEG